MKAICIGFLLASLGFLCHAAELEVRIDLGGATALDLRLVPAGEFTQGSPAEETGRNGDEAQRRVRLTQDFYMSRTSITRDQWEKFISDTGYRTEAETGKSGGFGWDGNSLVQRPEFFWRNPGFPQDSTHPVCLITFPDAQEFCRWLGKKSGREITLPTEAQWEYACRAGTSSAWHGTAADFVAWHKGNSGDGTRPVDSRPPNPWGLIIGGNVSEWCLDWYAPYDPSATADPLQQNANLSDKPRRVLRGGSWNRDAKNTRSAARFRADPRSRNADIGFRVVCGTAAPLAAAIDWPSETETESHPAASQDFTATGGFTWSPFAGLACLLIPIGMVIFIVRLITRGQKSGSPFTVTPAKGMPPVRQRHPTVRISDTGFWINSDWPVGTQLHLNYLLNGILEHQNLFYQPNAEGHFVFTGQRPDKVTVSGTGDAPPPFPPDPDTTDRHRTFSQSHFPSRNPSAY